MVLLFVRKTSGQVLAVDADMLATVKQLKDTITLVEGVERTRQTLIFAGRVLKDEATLSSYNISKECSVQLFTSALRLRSNAPSEADDSAMEKTESIHECESPKNSSQTNAIVEKKIPHPSDSEGGVSDALKHGDIVIIKLLQGRNLEKADFWPVISGSSDPYVIFALGNNSAKSRIVKRNLNPVWHETFGFRINEEDESAVVRVLVFDFDNFTPDDFIGSAEINLSFLKRGETVDTWINLENVETGQLHLQMHRSILTSPSLNTIVTSLMELERSWTAADLARFGVSLEQLSGETAWIADDTTNPAIEHLAESVRNNRVDWGTHSLNRISSILVTQNLLVSKGGPTRHLWFSGIAPHVKPKHFITELRKHSVVKHVKFPTGDSCAFVDFRSIGDALLCFLELQKHRYEGYQLQIGFGRYLLRDDDMLKECLLAGFLLVFTASFPDWQLCWVSLNGSLLCVYDELQIETPHLSIDASQCFVCNQGAHSLEIFRLEGKCSVFLRSDLEEEIVKWKKILRELKNTELILCSDKEKLSDDKSVIKNSKCTEQYTCSICSSSFALDEVYLKDDTSTGDYACVFCLRRVILKHMDSSECNSLSTEFSVQDIRDLLSHNEFDSFLDASLKELLDADDSFVKCPQCAVAVEFMSGEDVPDFARQTGVDGRVLSSPAQQHFLSNRLRCRNASCSADFCRSCLVTPFHAGFDCDEFQVYRVADHCRFCDTALMPRSMAPEIEFESLKKVCNAEECLMKRNQACTKLLECGHACGGVRDEKYCAPCLHPQCRPAGSAQDMNDFCNICFTECLSAAPCLVLECGHFFHFDCARRRLQERWPTPQITFGFCECPLCKIKMHHDLLLNELEPIFILHREIELRSYQRLEYEKLLSQPDLQEGGTFFRNAGAFGLKYFAYYMCFKCKEPYFGGQPRCDDGLDHFDPSELICGACSGIGVSQCSKHGKSFMVFKCRFCCSPSSWYCWGTTHFCDGCHRRQEAHDYLTTKSVEELDKCPGPEECPLGIEHPPNGTEYSLGCSLCRGGSSA